MTDTPYLDDMGGGSEDWLKGRTWEFDDNPEDFAKRLKFIGITWEQFKKLPAARACPFTAEMDRLAN